MAHNKNEKEITAVKLQKVFSVTLALIMVFSLGCVANGEDAAPLKIGVLKWVTHGALDSAEQGFVDALADNGFVDGENISIDYQNANDDFNIAATISDRFVNNHVDLILAIATPAVQSAQGKTTEIPILGTAVTDFVGAGLVASNEAPGANISGSSDLPSIAEQFAFMLNVLPDIKIVGIMYNSSEDNSRIQAEAAKEAADALGLTIVEKTFSAVVDIPQTVESLAKDVEIIWLPSDNSISSAMDILSMTAVEMNIPLACSEESQVVSGGTFAIGIDYYKLGYQTGEMAVRILKDGANPAEMPIEHLKDMAVSINKEMADAIGLAFPQDVLDQATDVSAG